MRKAFRETCSNAGRDAMLSRSGRYGADDLEVRQSAAAEWKRCLDELT